MPDRLLMQRDQCVTVVVDRPENLHNVRPGTSIYRHVHDVAFTRSDLIIHRGHQEDVGDANDTGSSVSATTAFTLSASKVAAPRTSARTRIADYWPAG